MNVERVFRILWGPTLENVLDFTWPVVGSSPVFSRAPRAGSVMVPNAASAFSWITGRYYRLRVKAQYFAGQQNFGATGLQAFIDWAADSNAFTLVPNLLLPTLTVAGCYLQGPFTELDPNQERDSTQTLALTILHPTIDLGIAWRGLFFEYVAGQSLIDPVRANYSRSSVGYEITPTGYLLNHPADSICDGHYPDRVSGIQTTLIEQAVTNDITNPEDLSNASWGKTFTTITVNNAKAPDQAITADLVVEDSSTNFHYILSPLYTIVANDPITAVVFLRDGGRFQGQVDFYDSANPNTNRAGFTFDLKAGTVASYSIGTGAVTAVRMTPLAGGWYMVWVRCAVNNSATSIGYRLILGNSAGVPNSYLGDGASGIYMWGVTAVHGAGKVVASYTPTTGAKDVLNYAYTVTPQAAWWYIKFVEGGGVYTSSVFNRLLELGVSEFANPSWDIVDATSVTLKSATGGTVSTGIAASSIGDIVELLLIIYSDASVELRQSINGGGETTSGRTAAPAGGMPTTWGAGARLGIGDNPTGTGARASATQMAIIKHGPFLATGPAAVPNIAAARFV